MSLTGFFGNKKLLASLGLSVIAIILILVTLAGASWYSVKVELTPPDVLGVSASVTISSQTNFFLTKFQTVSGDQVNSTSYSDIDKSNFGLSVIGVDEKPTNCVGAVGVAVGLTVANAILHIAHIGILFVQKGKLEGRVVKFAAASVLLLGLVLQIIAVATFENNNSCAKAYFSFSQALASVLQKGGYTVNISTVASG